MSALPSSSLMGFASWALLEDSWDPLGGTLGLLMGPLGDSLGASLGALGNSWGLLGAHAKPAAKDALKIVPRASRGPVDASRIPPEASKRAPLRGPEMPPSSCPKNHPIRKKNTISKPFL